MEADKRFVDSFLDLWGADPQLPLEEFESSICFEAQAVYVPVPAQVFGYSNTKVFCRCDCVDSVSM